MDNCPNCLVSNGLSDKQAHEAAYEERLCNSCYEEWLAENFPDESEDRPPSEWAGDRHAIKEVLKAKDRYWKALSQFENQTEVEVDEEMDSLLARNCSENPSSREVNSVLEKVKEKRS